MKFIRILPDTWASTRCPFSSSTRNMALGRGSTTVPSTSIASSLVIRSSHRRPRLHARPDLWAVLRDGDGVLEGTRQAAVLGDRRPAVFEDADLPGSHGHHRLDGQHHAGLEPWAAPGLPEVRHLRILVELPPDAVAHEGPHHPEAVALAVALHGVRDVAEAVAGTALADGLVEALARHVEQLLPPRRDGPHRQRDGAVGVVPLDDAAQVQPDDVPLGKAALLRRDAVDDLLVDGWAHRGRGAPGPPEGRLGAARTGES